MVIDSMVSSLRDERNSIALQGSLSSDLGRPVGRFITNLGHVITLI